ncbi:myosin light chain 3, skeletal muscle isoform-like [Dendronephthya gigantea]|uniref:myosin light chain 3, skeletal muscle isoform-like n=1 Tax=Dendronephthya gigantea TaxID=151771 RepID=UPI00106956DE|nr:myosin light chain 3, skeletal muscle isoform-like [Dendronephthya gigantea]
MSLSDDEIAEIKDTFLMFDTTGNDKVTVDEVGNIMRSCGLNPMGEEIDKFVDELGKGAEIDFEQYLGFHEECSKKGNTGTIEGFMEAWKCFDHEGNGFVGNAEIRHVLTSMGDRMTDEDVDEILEGKEDAEGLVNYEEFSKFVMSG